MTIEMLSIFTAVGIFVFFVLGFMFGLSCQSIDDRLKIRRLEKIIREQQGKMREAYELGRKTQKEETQARMDEEWERFVDSIGKEDQIKFGGF